MQGSFGFRPPHDAAGSGGVAGLEGGWHIDVPSQPSTPFSYATSPSAASPSAASPSIGPRSPFGFGGHVLRSSSREESEWWAAKEFGSPSWWATEVICSQVTEVKPSSRSSREAPHLYRLGKDSNARWLRMQALPLTAGPPHLLRGYLDRPITAFRESRQGFGPRLTRVLPGFEPLGWLAYHCFTVLEVDHGAMHILVERAAQWLEMMIGEGELPRDFMQSFRPGGKMRNLARCSMLPRQELTQQVTVRQLLQWIGGPLAEAWQPYSLLQANCQTFARDVQKFLLNAGSTQLGCTGAVFQAWGCAMGGARTLNPCCGMKHQLARAAVEVVTADDSPPEDESSHTPRMRRVVVHDDSD